MRFPAPLIEGTLIKRYNRFLADIRLGDGTVVTASCPNTGSMMGLVDPGVRVWLSTSDSPTRKYRHTWELVEADLGKGPALVGINTGHPNRLFADAIEAGGIAELTGYASLRREVKYGRNSRIDILLEDPAKGLCYVEVKNVHLSRTSGLAEFPDCVTARGAKHLDELADMVREGHRAVMVFLVQRADTKRLSVAREIDPGYGEAFDRAAIAGVEALAYACSLSTQAIEVKKRLPIAG